MIFGLIVIAVAVWIGSRPKRQEVIVIEPPRELVICLVMQRTIIREE